MRNFYIVILITFFILFPVNVESQSVDGLYKLDFSMPDIPAFNILDLNPSNILKPSTPNELGIQLSEFFNGSSVSIPSSFAFEVAPFLISESSPNSLQTYIDRDFLENIRISLATSKDTSNDRTNFSIGFRATIYDEAKNNIKNKIIKKVQYLKKFSEQRGIRIDYFLRKYGMNDVTYGDIVNKVKAEFAGTDLSQIPIENIKDKKNKIIDVNISEEDFNKFISIEEQTRIANKNELLEQINKDFDNQWNSSKFDIALASLFSSKDSTGEDTEFHSFNFWATYAYGTGSCQFLIGSNIRIINDIPNDKTLLNGGIGGRFYVGQKKASFFVEANYDYNELKENIEFLMINSGVEINLATNTWLLYNIGWEKEIRTNESNLISKLDFKYNISEILNIFKGIE